MSIMMVRVNRIREEMTLVLKRKLLGCRSEEWS